MNRILTILLPPLLTLALILSGCAQKDSAVGSDLAPGLNDIYPQDTTLYPVAANFYQTQATTGSSPFLYLGHDQGYDADILLKFNPATALPDSYLVDSLVVKLYLDSIITAESASLPVSVLLLNRNYTWYEIGVTWNNLLANPVYRYLPLDTAQFGDPIAAFDVSSAAADSDSITFTLPSPDSLLRAWEWVGTTGSKTLHYNNGLYLLSDKSQNFLMRFKSAENTNVARRPKLLMYLSVVDTSDTTGALPQDTVLFIYAGADDFIAQSTTTLDSSYLYLGNAAACRSLLLFDVEDLFPTYGVAVQRAEVVLHADTTNALNYGQIASAFFLEMQDSTWLDHPDSALTEPGLAYPVVFNADAGTLTLNLTDAVYNWIRNPGTNQGMMIKSSAEYYDLSRTVFYGPSAPDSLRPYLRIVYLEGPQ